ncbi:MAG: ABC transporter permease [Clostridiales bacterium]|nr:ABC transporter permease [Clostridiales bacterium]
MYFHEIQIVPDYVLVGFEEHVRVGHRVNLLLPLQETITTVFTLSPDPHIWTMLPFDPLDLLPVYDISVGGRYLFRATYYTQLHEPELRSNRLGWHEVLYPRIIPGVHYNLMLKPLDFVGELWYLPAPRGVELDIGFLNEQMTLMNENQHAMTVFTTKDMTAMPSTQDVAYRDFLVDGRFLNHEDYLNANPVVVVNSVFAGIRNIGIGDTITFNMRDISSWQLPPISANTNWQEYDTYLVELEVVGTYTHGRQSPHLNLPRDANSVFVPESIIPQSFQQEANVYGINFSFVLNDPRDEAVFMVNYGPQLSALGFNVVLLEHDGANFFPSADAIRQSITINMAVFSVVFVIVLALAAFLYARQGRKEFAILRALGMPARRVVWQNFIPVILLWLPIMLIGIFIAWEFAHNLASETLAGLFLEIDYYGETSFSLDMAWFVAIVAVSIGATLLCVGISNIFAARRPVLELLQGSVAKAAAEAIETREAVDSLEANENKAISQTSTSPEIERPKGRRKNIIFFALRRIVVNIIRSPIKTALSVLVAVFFLLSLGFLNDMMERTEAEIEHLYDTTIISAEIRPREPGLVNAFIPMNNHVFTQTVEALQQSPFVIDYYVTGAYPWHMLVLPDADGNFPENFWMDLFTYNPDFMDFVYESTNTALIPHLDWLYAPSNIADFIEHNRPDIAGLWGATAARDAEGNRIYDEDGMPVLIHAATAWPEITFGAGFGEEDFVFERGAPIPAIINETRLEELGLSVGDFVYSGYGAGRELTQFEIRNRQLGLVSGPFLLEIIGSYSGFVGGLSNLHPIRHRTTIIPLEALYYIREGAIVGHVRARFYIDPAMNRNTEYVRSHIEEILEQPRASMVPLISLIDDSTLRYVVGPLESNLNLLRILYPIALVITFVLSAGLSILLMLQNAKIAALLRTLGSPKGATRLVLVLEQLFVCALGITLGLAALPLFGISFGAALAILVALYLSGALIGASFGSVVITNKSPLALLQVKE